MLGPPAELLLELSGVDGIAVVMAGTIGTKVISPRRELSAGASRSRLSQMASTTARLVRSLRPPTLYLSPGRPAVSDQMEGARMILDVEPVAHVRPVAVDGQRLPSSALRIVSGISFSGK